MASGTVYSDTSKAYTPPKGIAHYFNTWLTYSTSDSSSSVTVSASMGVKIQPDPLAVLFQTSSLACTGKTTVSRSDMHSSSSSANTTFVATQKWTIAKGTSAKTITLTASAHSDRWGQTLSKSQSISIPALAHYTVSYNANGGSGAPSSQTKYYGIDLTLSSTKPTRSGYTFVGWNTSSSATTSKYAAGGKYTGNAALSLYAIWKKTITVSYNANGGSGAPSSQSAAVYNSTTSYQFTLSTTKPTRTGHTFKGWATSSSASSASYQPGSKQTFSSNTALYAVWQKNTYTVSFNANTGSGAPSSQTKTYGTDLTLSSTKPTKRGYKFMGWATSSNGAVKYQPGGKYTDNAGATLYAIWTQSYFAPKITNLTATRAASNGSGGYKEDDVGTVAHIKFNWSAGTNDGATVTPSHLYVSVVEQGSTEFTETEITPIPSSPANIYLTSPVLQEELLYDVRVRFTVPDWDDVTGMTYISVAYYIIDINPDGTAIGFGGVVDDEDTVFKVYMDIETLKDIVMNIDDSASSGTIDGDLYSVMNSLGWIS